MNGIRAFRKVVAIQRRNMSVTDIFENKNQIAKVRKQFYSNPEAGAGNPTYLKETGDKVTTAVALSFFGLGFCLVVRGVYKMAYNQKE